MLFGGCATTQPVTRPQVGPTPFTVQKEMKCLYWNCLFIVHRVTVATEASQFVISLCTNMSVSSIVWKSKAFLWGGSLGPCLLSSCNKNSGYSNLKIREVNIETTETSKILVLSICHLTLCITRLLLLSLCCTACFFFSGWGGYVKPLVLLSFWIYCL